TNRALLLRVENFQQWRCRISAEVRAYLVDLIEHEHRIARSGATNALDDLTGKGADIRTPMAAYLSFVAHASERNAHKFAVHGIGNRTSKGRLAHTWRPDETQNRGFALRFQLEHSEVFEN